MHARTQRRWGGSFNEKAVLFLALVPVRFGAGEIYTFAPAIDQFLKSHLLGDIFGRDNLGYQSRPKGSEIATKCHAIAQTLGQ
jgi:hypothetical protein